jgi:hypothetical protein
MMVKMEYSPTFGGYHDEDIEEFFVQLEAWMAMKRIVEDNDRRNYIGPCLRGAARDFYMGTVATLHTYNDRKNRMITQYTPADRRRYFERLLHQMVMGDSESPLDFFSRLTIVAKRARPGIQPADVTARNAMIEPIFMQGLTDNLRGHIATVVGLQQQVDTAQSVWMAIHRPAITTTDDPMIPRKSLHSETYAPRVTHLPVQTGTVGAEEIPAQLPADNVRISKEVNDVTDARLAQLTEQVSKLTLLVQQQQDRNPNLRRTEVRMQRNWQPRPQGPGNALPGRTERVCYRCGLPGHMIRNCPMPIPGNNRQTPREVRLAEYQPLNW